MTKAVRITACAVLLLSAFSFQLSAYGARAEHSFDNLERLFLEEKYDKAVIEADNLIDERANRRDEIYYLKGLSEMLLRRFSGARQSFETVVSRYPDSKVAFDAYTGIGDAYLVEGNTRSAVRVYKEVLSNYPKDRNISMVQKRLADCNRKLEQAASLPAVPVSGDESKILPKGIMSVQVGSFVSKGNADKLSRKLIGKGYDSYVETPTGSGKRVYRVKVGRLSSAKETQELASRLKKNGYSVKICTDDTCQ